MTTGRRLIKLNMEKEDEYGLCIPPEMLPSFIDTKLV